MSDELQTVSPDQVAVANAVPANAFVFMQQEGGPLQRVPYDLVLAKLIAAGLVKSSEALLQADLAHDADTVALVDNDPEPLKCGWYRKTGASGAGEWLQFEQLAKAVRQEALNWAATSQAWASGNEPGGLGTKSAQQWAGEVALQLDAISESTDAIADGWDNEYFETIDDDLGNAPGWIPALDPDRGIGYLRIEPVTSEGGDDPLISSVWESVDDPGFEDWAILDPNNAIGTATSFFGGAAVVGEMAGTRPDAAERIASTLNDYGDPRGPCWGRDLLRQCHARFEALDCRTYAATVTKLAIGFGGDSYIEGENFWLSSFTRKMHDKYGFGGQGYTGCAWYGAGSGNYVLGGAQPGNGVTNSCALPRANTEAEHGGGSKVYAPRVQGAWTCDPRNGSNNAPQIARITSATAGDFVQWWMLAGHDSAQLFADSDGTGVIRYSWDLGVTWSANIGLAAGPQRIALAGVPASAGTLRVAVVSGSVSLSGVSFTVENVSGVVVHKLGASGSTSTHWSGMNGATWAAGAVSALGLHFLGILLGTNDGQSGGSAAALKANVKKIADAARAARPGIDTMLIAAPETPADTNTVPAADYAAVLRKLAIDEMHAFVDTQPLFQRGVGQFGGPEINPSLYANANAEFPGMAADGIHPNPNSLIGGGVIRAALRRMMEF